MGTSVFQLIPTGKAASRWAHLDPTANNTPVKVENGVPIKVYAIYIMGIVVSTTTVKIQDNDANDLIVVQPFLPTSGVVTNNILTNINIEIPFIASNGLQLTTSANFATIHGTVLYDHTGY